VAAGARAPYYPRGVLRPVAALVVVLLGLTAACTTRSEVAAPDTASAGGALRTAEQPIGVEHNETDVAYAHEISAMHRQAVDMVAMLGNREVPPQVRELAAQIGQDRSDELVRLGKLLRTWRVPPHGADYHGNPGELTMREMADLYALEGAEFEEQWVARIVANHRGAVAMSRAELEHGLNAAARDLARQLAETQAAQAAALEDMGS
jgi:uncharacterized protein (DUF305 family)